MKHSDFEIGTSFLTASGEWRCTDIGRRTITAIHIEPDRDPSWYSGPPYAVAEIVFDEYDLEGCYRTEVAMQEDLKPSDATHAKTETK